jgi:hypothetical protein
VNNMPRTEAPAEIQKDRFMTNVASCPPAATPERSPSVNRRAQALADRLEEGARALATFANGLTDAQWHTPVLRDGRKIGVVVHHVASVYPLEIQLAQTLAGGKPITGVTMENVHELNAWHAKEHDTVTKEQRSICSGATARLRRRQSGPSATRSSIGPPRHRSTRMPRSRVSSCSRITPSGTVITTSPASNER